MRSVSRVKAALLAALLLLLVSEAAASVSDAHLEALQEALDRTREDETGQQAHHREKRQFVFGNNRRRNRNQNLYPGRNGEIYWLFLVKKLSAVVTMLGHS